MNTMDRIERINERSEKDLTNPLASRPDLSNVPDVQDSLHGSRPWTVSVYRNCPRLYHYPVQDQGIQDPSRSKSMSTHDEIYNALSDAMSAYRREPALEVDLKSARDDRDFARLELDEARAEIDRLRATVCRLEDEVLAQSGKISSLCTELAGMSDRNAMLAQSLDAANASIRDHIQAREEASQLIQLLTADKAALAARLEDSRGYGSRLAEMLKGFGSAIQSAVAEPAVSDSAPFPTPNPVGMPVSTELKSIAPSLDEVGNEPSPALDMAQPQRVESVGSLTNPVKVPEEIAQPVTDTDQFTKDGIYPSETPWWNR